MSSFSVIIPCYHDEAKVANLLNQLQNVPHRPMEVVVVDGANDQACRKVCNQYGARWLADEPCRGRQLLSGAALAQGDVLWFLHADARLPPDPIMAMKFAIEQGAIGGYFRFRFDTPRAWPALLLEPAIAFRCRFGVPYGDQGLIHDTAGLCRGRWSFPLALVRRGVSGAWIAPPGAFSGFARTALCRSAPLAS